MKKSEVNIMAERIVIKARVINQAIAFEDKDVRLALRIPEYGIDIIV